MAGQSHSNQPTAYRRLIEQLGTLPGIGPRSAARIAFSLLRQPTQQSKDLAQAIIDFTQQLKACSRCGQVSEVDPCAICTDLSRDQQRLLVVEEPTDIALFEDMAIYRGLYHVLMGRWSPIDGVGRGDLTMDKLVDRVRSLGVAEVILALSPTIEGDATAMQLSQMLEPVGVKVTRLPRGLPSGQRLDSVSKAVLFDALQSRRPIDE